MAAASAASAASAALDVAGATHAEQHKVDAAEGAGQVLPEESLRGVYQVLFGCHAIGQPLGLLMESALALAATGVPVIRVCMAALNNNPIASITVRADESMYAFRLRVTRIMKQSCAIELYALDPSSDTLQCIGDAAASDATVGGLRRSAIAASATSDADVVVVQGKPHDMKLTCVQNEHDRGDIDCPQCKKTGPHRYTGHTTCVKCRLCMFCAIDSPFCGSTTQPNACQVHWQSRTDWDTAQRFAQHRSELDRFYAWQRKIMKM